MSKETLGSTLSKLIASSYREDGTIMGSVCMSAAVDRILEMMPVVRELVEQRIADSCYVENYEEYEEILHVKVTSSSEICFCQERIRIRFIGNWNIWIRSAMYK